METRRERKIRFQDSLEILGGKTLVGLYLEDVDPRSHPRLSREEEHRLAVKIDQGDQTAFEEIFFCNTGLVLWIAKAYREQGLEVGLGFPDLIQEGNIGLLEALAKWRPEVYNTKLSTYAFWKIVMAISRAIDNEGLVRLPVALQQLRRKVVKTKAEITSRAGHDATVDEIADHTGLKKSEVETALDVHRRVTRPMSLDEVLWFDENSDERRVFEGLVDLWVDNRPSIVVEEADRIRQELASILTPSQLRIVELRFGLGGGETLNQQEIADKIKRTRQYVWNVERYAFRKIAKSPYFRDLLSRLTGRLPSDE